MAKVKIVVTVPVGEANDLRKAIGEAGGGKVGNYSFCSFSIKGIGRFLPNEDANPAIGQSGKFESVEEERVEITCDESEAKDIVKAIRDAHSYEEPAVDVYTLIDL